MTNRFMISVAVVALIAGTGLASAQSGGMGREGAGASAQQSGTSSERGTSGGQMSHDAARPEMKSTQSEEKSPAGKNQRAEESKQGSKNKTLSSENAEKGKTVGQSMKNEGQEDKNAQREGREQNKNAQRNDEKMNENKNAQRNDEKMNENKNAQRSDEKMNSENGRHSTVGQAGAGAKLSTEQRTKITTVIREQHVAPVTHVNFSISVGTRVPRDVTFHTLPTEVVSIYPEWRGYEYILVGDQLVVIDPQSQEIVAVLDT